MTIKVASNYDEKQVMNLYTAVGWTNYTSSPDMLKTAYENSLYVLGAYDGDKLI